MDEGNGLADTSCLILQLHSVGGCATHGQALLSIADKFLMQSRLRPGVMADKSVFRTGGSRIRLIR